MVSVITEEISRPDRGHYDVNTTISIKVSQSLSQGPAGPIMPVEIEKFS